MRKKTLNDVAARAGRPRIVVRVDFNVPLRDGRVADDTRIERTLPTLRRLTATGARLVLLSHLGRPGGRPHPEASLRPVAARLGETPRRSRLRFSPRDDGAGGGWPALARSLPARSWWWRNTRFSRRRKRANDPELATAFRGPRKRTL